MAVRTPARQPAADPLAWLCLPLAWLPSRYMAHSLVMVVAIIAMEITALGPARHPDDIGCIDPEVLTPRETPHLEAALIGSQPVSDAPAAFSRPAIIRYTVAEGDSLWAIADRHGVSMETIRWANGIDEADSVLQVGKELVIPPVSGVLHTVQPGDTLRALALAYDSDSRAIASINGLDDPNRLSVGQQLIIPGGRLPEYGRSLASAGSAGGTVALAASRPAGTTTGVGAAAPVAAARPAAAAASMASAPARPAGPPIATYELKPGETLHMVAQRFGVKTTTILANNPIDDDTAIPVGTTLKVPLIDGLLYTFKEGDTISDLARATGASEEAIMRFNGISDPRTVQKNQTLVLPNVGAPQGVALRAPAPSGPTSAAAPSAPVPAAPAAASGGAGAGRAAQPAAAQGQPLRAPAPGGAPQAAVGKPLQPPADGGSTGRVAASPLGGKVVGLAGQYLGYRYTWGGTQPSTGFDCSGFTYYVYRQAGQYIPRDLWGQVSAGPRVARGDLQPGDLVFFQNTYTAGLSHSGIYIGGGRFIHAGSESTGVLISSLNEPYWNARYYGASRPGAR